MPMLKKGLLLPSVVLLSACSLFTVDYQIENKEAFVHAKTYSWKSQPIERSASVNANQILIDQNMRTSINQVMNQKGYQLTQESSDLYLDYNYKLKPITVAVQPEVSEASISFSRDTGITKSNADIGNSTISLKANFTVEVFGANPDNRVYRVTTDTKDIAHESSEDLLAHIDDLSKKMLSTLPERSKETDN